MIIKYFICFYAIFLFSDVQCFASFTICPAQVSTRPNYYHAWKFLKRLPSRIKYGDCSVEFHICSMSSSTSATDDIIGDVLVQTPKGHEQYISLVFPKESLAEMNVNVDANERYFHYHYLDKIFNDLDGAKQKASLNILMVNPNHPSKAFFSISTFTSFEHNEILGLIPISIWSICSP